MAKLNFPASPLTGTLYSENGNVWKWNGTSWISFNSLDLTGQVSGALGVTHGGTGYTTFTLGDLLVGAGNTIIKFPLGGNGYVLAVDASSASGVTWAATGGGSGTVYSGNIYEVPVYLATGNALSGSTNFLNVGTGLTILYSADSANSSSGALVVAGGVGIGKSLSIDGRLQLFNSPLYTAFVSSQSGVSTVYTLPSTTPSAVGTSVLSSSQSGVLSWIPMVASTTGGASGTVANANQYEIAYYALTGSSVSGNSNFTFNSNNSNSLTLGGMTFVGSGNSAITITSVPNGGQILSTWNTLNSGLALDALNASLRIVGDTNAGTTLVDLGTYDNSGFPTGNWNSKYLFPKTTPAIFQNGLKIEENVDSISTTSGALQVVGGVGITGNAFIGGTVTASTFTGNLTGTASFANYATQSGQSTSSGFATTASNINLVSTSENFSHSLIFTRSSTSASGAGLSINSNLQYNPNSNILNLNNGSLAANGITIGLSQSTITTSSGNLILNSASGNVQIPGNLIVEGNTISIGSTISTLLDPILVLGAGIGGTNPIADDNKDRGIEFRYFSGSAKTGFFGWDDSEEKFVFYSDAINTNETFSGTLGTAKFANVYSNLIGTATTSQNIQIQSGFSNTQHKLIFTNSSNSSGSALSTNSTLVYNPFSDLLTVSSLAVTSPVASTSTSTGALIVTGGVGIGDSLYTSPTSPDSISGVILNNSVITSGSWAGSVITSRYGGTGFSTFNKGDLLVGDANSFLNRLPVGDDRSVLIGSSYSGYGISWQPLLAPAYGVFGSGATHQATATGTTVISYDTTYESNRVSITPTVSTGNTTRIYIQDSGTFLFQATLQNNLLTTNQPRDGEFWFRINGVDRPDSNSRTTVTGQSAEQITSLQYVTTVVADSYVELVMYSSTADFAVNTFTNLTLPTRPDIPSVVFSVTPIANILPSGATGISGLASLNALTSSIQTFAVGESGINFNISSLGSVHTFNIPNAGTLIDRGLITNSTQTIAGLKTFSNDLTLSSLTESSSAQTGALIVNGGLGVTGNAFIGGTLSALLFTGNVSATAITASNFYGALQGTATTATNVNVVSGFANTTYYFPLIGSTSGSGLALTSGFGLSYNPVSTTLYTGTVNANLTGTVSGNLIGNASTATTASNVGVEAGSSNQTHWLIFSPTQTGSGVALSTNNSAGSALTYNPSTGIISIGGTAIISQRLTVEGNLNSSSTSTGALVNSGGLGLGGNAFIGGTVTITNETASTGVSSGALVVRGGLGVSGSVYVGKMHVMAAVGESKEGGEIFLEKAPNSTFSTGLTIDIYEDKLRFFEQGGSARGYYLDITAGGNGVGTNIMGGSSSGTVNSGTATYAAYYPSSTNAVSAIADLQFTGTGVSIGGNINPTSSSTGSLKVFGGVGIGGTLFVNGMVRVGSNTFTKNYSQGDISLDNGSSSDTPALTFYYNNNKNFGIDAFSSGAGSTRWRVVKEINETGGAELFSIDTTGTISIYNASSPSNYSGFKYSGSAQTVYTLPSNTPQSSLGTSVLSSTIAGVMSWVPLSSGGSNPSGVNGDIQFNRSGSLGATSNLSYIEGSSELRIDRFLFNGEASTTSSAALRITGTNATFSGSSNGTYLAINTVSGFGGNIIDAQVNNTSKFSLSNTTASFSIPLTITDATNSTSTSDGALQITGGAGFGKSINVGGNISARSGYELRVYESTNNYYSGFKYTGASASPIYTLPNGYPGSGTSILQSNTSGSLSWTAPFVEKRIHRIQFATSYNPTSGADSAVFTIPFDPNDGTSSMTMRMKRVECRVEAASSIGSSFRIEKYAYRGGLGVTAFNTDSSVFIGSTTNILSTPLIIQGSDTYESNSTTFAGSHITAVSGDKLRLNFLQVSAIHQNFSISLLMEQDI